MVLMACVHLVEPGGAQLAFGSATASRRLPAGAESGALGAARGLRALLQFLFEIGVVLGAHTTTCRSSSYSTSVTTSSYFQHILIEQIASANIPDSRRSSSW